MYNNSNKNNPIKSAKLNQTTTFGNYFPNKTPY